MQVDEITLRAVNTKRRNMGKPPLSRREANHAARNYSALDISSLLTTYTPYTAMPDDSFSGDGGTFGGGGASGSWSDSSSSASVSAD
jgi:hypothetical protein